MNLGLEPSSTHSMTLGKLFNLSEHYFPHL